MANDINVAIGRGHFKDPVELAAGCIPYETTEVGAAERFAAMWMTKALWCPEMRVWLVWNGRCWEGSDEKAVELALKTARNVQMEAHKCPGQGTRKLLQKFAMTCERASTIRAMMGLARGIDGMWARADWFDNNPWLLNVANGVIDLKTGVLRGHAPEFKMRKISKCRYERGFRCGMWDNFIREATNGDEELMGYMQRACGYSLTGLTSEKCLFFVFSTAGNTGKSCLLGALQSVLGEYAVTINIDVFAQDSRDKYDIAKLQGARLAALSEIEEGKRLGGSLLKRITGDDRIRARDCGEKSIEFKPQFKIWMIANHAPLLSSTDQALWNRVRRVPFNHEVAPEKRDVRIIQASADPGSDFCKAFLAWAVEGCLAWQARGNLGTAAVIEASTAEYRDEMNPLKEFFDEHCRVDAQAVCLSSVLFSAYLEWAKEMHIKPGLMMNMRTFRARVEGNGFVYKRTKPGIVVCGIEPLGKDELGLGDAGSGADEVDGDFVTDGAF